MKIGFDLASGLSVSWRADAADVPGSRRLELLRQCTSMDELPDDGCASCCIVPMVDNDKSLALRNHLMRIEYSDDLNSVRCAFRDPRETAKHPAELVWRGVRKLMFAGLVPYMLRRECFMMHGALLERDGRAVVISGPSGIGKSTTALRMGERFRILADDCLLIYRGRDGWKVRPAPTWSVYLFAKSALAKCDIRAEYPLSQILILGRNAAKYIPLSQEEAVIGVAPSFTDMIQWHMICFPEAFCRKLREAALDAAIEVVRAIPCGSLQLTLDCDIFSLLPDAAPESENTTPNNQ